MNDKIKSMMKKFLILAVCALLLANVNEAFAQSNSNDEVALVVSSEGNTEEEAMKSALITAVSSVCIYNRLLLNIL